MDQIFTNKTSMSIVTCPVCHRAITVFMDTSPDSEMACPLCSSAFSFQQVLDAMPPMLQLASEVKSTPELQLQPEESKFAFDEVPAPPVPRKSTSGARRRRKKQSSSSSSPSSSGGPWDAKTARKRKAAFKKKNPMREVVLFFVGGLMALPVGQLLIWWVLGKDPLNFGPPVASVAGFVVPEKFHGKQRVISNDEDAKKEDDAKDSKTDLLPAEMPLPEKDPDAIIIDPKGMENDVSHPKLKSKKKDKIEPPKR